MTKENNGSFSHKTTADSAPESIRSKRIGAAVCVLTVSLLLTFPGCTYEQTKENNPDQKIPGTTAAAEPQQTAPSATEAAAAEPEATPMASPAPEAEVEGVELLEAEWTDGEGDETLLKIVARIPGKNVKRGVMIGDFYAWINGKPALPDWDAIQTPSDLDTTTEETENGDRIVTFKGTMYWPKNKPTQSDSITVAATGYDTKEQKETEPSNALTVRFGENVKKETQSGTNG